ncbi:hypothetical protein GGP41_001446 [Bipolaris sorokiniana]|uniref:Uncharacterized protein n=1 Tax=Cochliobolus sativus TaxID=45130 RepID=A0A8H5Z9G2_COCSA|nr:hypothetical protein GGP41_001446 [Bipolaris sorokiniana]
MVLACSRWLILAPKVRFRFLSEDFPSRLQLKDFKIRFRRGLINISGYTSLLMALKQLAINTKVAKDIERRNALWEKDDYRRRNIFNGSVAFFDSLKPVLYLQHPTLL